MPLANKVKNKNWDEILKILPKKLLFDSVSLILFLFFLIYRVF